MNYLDKNGLQRLWTKIKELYIRNPQPSSPGQILTKTDTGVKWADPLSNSDVPSSYLYASVEGDDHNTVLEGRSYKNFTISNDQIDFNDPGMYLVTMKFGAYNSDNRISVTLKTNKNYIFSGNNVVYTFIVASTSDEPAQISYSFYGFRSTQRVFFSIRKIQDDIVNYIILNRPDNETLDVISGIGIEVTHDVRYDTYTLNFSKNGTYKLSAYSVTSKDTYFRCSFPQDSNSMIMIYDGDEIYFEINNIYSDKLIIDGRSNFTDFIVTVEEV